MAVEERLKELGIVLPAAPAAAGAYVPTVRVGDLLFVAGQLPYENGTVKVQGKLGKDLTIEVGYSAARQCGLNAVSQIKEALGSLDNIKKFVRVVGFINSVDGFGDQPKVLNGASELFGQIFGDRGKHTRLAIGVNSLPKQAAVEIEVLVEV